MKFYKIKESNKNSPVVANFDVAQVKRLANALMLDILSDETSETQKSDKEVLLDKLKRLITE